MGRKKKLENGIEPSVTEMEEGNDVTGDVSLDGEVSTVKIVRVVSPLKMDGRVYNFKDTFKIRTGQRLDDLLASGSVVLV